MALEIVYTVRQSGGRFLSPLGTSSFRNECDSVAAEWTVMRLWEMSQHGPMKDDTFFTSKKKEKEHNSFIMATPTPLSMSMSMSCEQEQFKQRTLSLPPSIVSSEDDESSEGHYGCGRDDDSLSAAEALASLVTHNHDHYEKHQCPTSVEPGVNESVHMLQIIQDLESQKQQLIRSISLLSDKEFEDHKVNKSIISTAKTTTSHPKMRVKKCHSDKDRKHM